LSIPGCTAYSNDEMLDMWRRLSENVSDMSSLTLPAGIRTHLDYHLPVLTGAFSSAGSFISDTHTICTFSARSWGDSVDQVYGLRETLYCLTAWLILELLFGVVVYFFVLPALQASSKPLAYPTDTVDFLVRTLNTVSDLDCYSLEQYVSGFFRGAKFEDVRLENFKSFLAWAMYSKHLHDVTKEEEECMRRVIDLSSREHPALLSMKPGFNPDIKHVAMTLEPIPIIHRPLIAYVGVHITEIAANYVFLRFCGFQCLDVSGMKYWYRKQTANFISDGHERDCLLFMHGITTGWALYLNFVKNLAAGRSVVLIEVGAIKIKSMNFSNELLHPKLFSEKVMQILERHAIPKISIVGHSFGSISAGWLVSRYPERISHMTLVDPVSMLLGFPDVAYNFLYRPPQSVMEYVIHFCACREITISHMLHRNFWWYSNVLWLEDVPYHIGVVVGIAGKDEIINAKAVHEYVLRCRLLRLEREFPSDDEDGIHAPPCPPRLRRQPSLEDATKADYTSLRSFRSVDSFGLADGVSPWSDGNTTDREGSGSPMSETEKIIPRSMIECHMWDSFSHGQILIPNRTQQSFIDSVHANEKRTKMLGVQS
ncbi:hypothetical protein B484DRAFT_456827, partial [Ochromonadaceae sp. CCMP2298]